jgi:cyclopropane fatty-acyl-phospholipid synthase-like methyltransferase
MPLDLASQFLKTAENSVPLAIEQIDIMLRLIGAARDPVKRFLDLGSGDGVLSAVILDEYPGAQGVLIAPSMSALNSARKRLYNYGSSMTLLTADLASPEWLAAVQSAIPFDAVVSAFAIGHLAAARKRTLYAELLPLLATDGIFLNIEHVASATRWTESILDDYVINALFGSVIQESPGKSRAEVAREYFARAGNGEHLAPLEVQLDWLRECGFVNVECFLKVLELAVFGGQRGGGE